MHVKLAIFSRCWALDVCTLDHDRLIDHILYNNSTCILLISCADLKCDKDGSSCIFNWIHIPLISVSIYFLYCSYIFVSGIPIYLTPASPVINKFRVYHIFQTGTQPLFCLNNDYRDKKWQGGFFTRVGELPKWVFAQMEIYDFREVINS